MRTVKKITVIGVSNDMYIMQASTNYDNEVATESFQDVVLLGRVSPPCPNLHGICM